MSETNPCLGCGICCTHFRISFYWAEADDAPGGTVPAGMTEKLNDFLRCMKGSNSLPRRCTALQGEVGVGVSCSIYAQRPSPCREFPVYLEDGSPNPRCDSLRATIGLPPLLPSTWPAAA
ncbi:MAG: YkgJ family cysteine cluster protein [Rhodocyclaceae bacterium]|nr:YkgJ family cysteine cluster protein [Rhodocyclaceae bacterium]